MLRHAKPAAPTVDEASELDRSRGQVLILFAGMLTMLLGMSAFVVDLAWIWSHQLKVQRAADAGALAGVVWLPGDEPAAQSAAEAAATANGYTDGVGGVVVDAREDPADDNRILVDVSAPVETFFMRLFGWDEVTVTRRARAEYVLPVPMGSPENYYGVFGKVRTPDGGTTIFHPHDTGWLNATVTKGTNTWTTPENAYASDDQYASSSSTSARQSWGNFGITLPAGATVTGIEVAIEGSWSGSGTTTNCRFNVWLSYNNGSSHTSDKNSPALPAADPAAPYQITGGSTDTWGRTWTATNLDNTNFRVRLEPEKPTCSSSILHRVDSVWVRVHSTTSEFIPDENLDSPYGDTLAPRGFWGTMLAQGSYDMNGDAYLPYYDQRTTKLNPEYDPDGHYDYAVEVQPGTSNGEVWIYDPVFCAVAPEMGTGDRFFTTTSPISAFYYLYDTQGTLFDMSDDTLVADSGTLFRRIRASDPTLDGPDTDDDDPDPDGYEDCRQWESGGTVTDPADGRYWHNRWWQLASGLQGGHLYRVRTSTTDPNSPTDQLNSDGQNSFAIWTTASGADAPDVYGIGAMEAFTPLASNEAATFYLAQIEAIHAGKTVRIELWDPGDTQSLPATLQILIPTATGYTNATFDWTAELGTTNSQAICRQTSGSGVTSIMSTDINGVQQFQGCWVTIEVPIPTDYTAPTPPGEQEGGWWKINYVMGSGSAPTAYDVTTWQVEIRGNPVRLVVP